MKRAYGELVQAWRRTCCEVGGEFTRIADFEGYPIYGARLGSVDIGGDEDGGGAKPCPQLLLTSGLHGDEPGAVYGLLAFAQQDIYPYLSQLGFHILPCLNPGGLQQGTRHSEGGVDLNRAFEREDSPIVQGFHRFLQGCRFDLSIDLHEDSEYRRFYLWEISPQPTWGPVVIEGVREVVEVSHRETPDGSLTEQGVTHRTYAEVTEKIRARLGGRPLSHFVSEYWSACALTTELPGLLPFAQRLHIERLFLQHTATEYIAAGLRKGTPMG